DSDTILRQPRQAIPVRLFRSEHAKKDIQPTYSCRGVPIDVCTDAKERVLHNFGWRQDSLHGSWLRKADRLHPWLDYACVDLGEADRRIFQEVSRRCRRSALAG